MSNKPHLTHIVPSPTRLCEGKEQGKKKATPRVTPRISPDNHSTSRIKEIYSLQSQWNQTEKSNQ